MRARGEARGDVDLLFRDLLEAGERPAALRAALTHHAPDETLLLAVLRRTVPVKLLELLASTPPWSESTRLLGGLVLSPRVPQALAQRLLPSLSWLDLALVAAAYRLPAALRMRAESLLAERLPELRLGDRIALARLATPAVLRLLLQDELRVVRAALLNPRLRETDLVLVLQREAASLALLREAAASTRWRENYAVRLALVLQPRTPLGVALAQLTALLPRDLRRVAATEGLAPLVQAAALRVARDAGNTRP